MKKVLTLLLVGVIAITSPTATVRAESYGEWDLEKELSIDNDLDELKEPTEEDGITFDDNDDDMIRASQWVGKDKHGKGHSTLPLCVMDYFNNKKNKALIQKCLIFASENADNELLHNKDAKIMQLHGFGNYILHLNALWLYAKKISANKNDATCRAEILNELHMKNSGELNYLNMLLNTIPKIYKLYKNQENHNPNQFEKEFLVLGLSLHLIGDIYAHRTIVTIQGVDRAVGDGIMKLSDFNPDKDFLGNVKAGRIRCSKIGEYMKQIPKHNRFEDDTAFMPERFVYSKKTCKTFIQNYVQNAHSFSPEYIKRSTSDGITLEGFDNYR